MAKPAYVNREVYAGPGRRFLNPATQDFLHAQPKRWGSRAGRGCGAAADVVQAASRAAAIDPPANGIGGDVRVVVSAADRDHNCCRNSR